MKDILTESGTPKPDYKAMSDNELEWGIHMMKTELRRREQLKREEAWQRVRTALQDYIEEFGPIRVYDDSGCEADLNYRMAGELDPGEIVGE